MTRLTRILCVRLTHWPIDRIRRRSPALRHEPLTLIQAAGRQLVSSVSDRCAAAGVREGMTLAEARALCPGLKHIAHDPQQDLRALHALARWLVRFSPVVAPWPPDAVMVDVGGSERLFGGLDLLLARAASMLAALKIHARLAIAPNPSAAWAIATFGASGSIVSAEQLIETLSPLPPAALRIDPLAGVLLKQLGIETIGQFMGLPRAALPARFGPQLLKQLDAALGRISDPLLALEHRSDIEASIEFDGEVESPEALHLAMRDLLHDLINQLAVRGCGVRLMRLRLMRMYLPPIDKIIRLSRPTRRMRVLFNLLRCAHETVQSDSGFVAVHLCAIDFEKIAEEQLLLQEHEEQIADDELDHLIEMLGARLGPRSIVQTQLVESHLPESACRRVEARSAHCMEAAPAIVRPLRLLAAPLPLTAMASPSHMPVSFTHEGSVHRLSYVDGPERISGMWWEGRDKTRDYFDVEDESGQRFWIFRVMQTGRWFLHGHFV